MYFEKYFYELDSTSYYISKLFLSALTKASLQTNLFSLNLSLYIS